MVRLPEALLWEQQCLAKNKSALHCCTVSVQRKLGALICVRAADAGAIEPTRAVPADSMEGDEASTERGSEASSTSCHNINVAVRFRPLRCAWRTLENVSFCFLWV